MDIKVRFRGREKNAIGTEGVLTATVNCPSTANEVLRAKLYQMGYDSITEIKVLNKGTDQIDLFSTFGK